jgi:hypothetical protein
MVLWKSHLWGEFFWASETLFNQGYLWSRNWTMHSRNCPWRGMVYMGNKGAEGKDAMLLRRQKWPLCDPSIYDVETMMLWFGCSFQNWCWNFIANVTEVRGGTFKRWFSYWGCVIMNGLRPLSWKWVSYKRGGGFSFLFSSFFHKILSYNMIPSAMLWHSKKVLTRCGPSVLDLPFSRSMSQINSCCS